MPLFLLIDWLLSQPTIARYLFDRFRTPDNVRQVLQVRSVAAGCCPQLAALQPCSLLSSVLLLLFYSAAPGPAGPLPAA